MPAPLGECALLQVAICGEFGRLRGGATSCRAEERVRVIGFFDVEVIDALHREVRAATHYMSRLAAVPAVWVVRVAVRRSS